MKITDDLLKEWGREKCTVVNPVTGEVLEDVYKINPNLFIGKNDAHKAAARNRTIAERQHQVELVTAARVDDEHKFVFHIYQACVDTFPDMPPAHLTRLMYLATFSGYNGNLIGDNRKALTKSIIQKKMGLSKPVFYKFWDDMVSRGILVDEGVSVYLNKDIFFKGQMTNQMIASYQKSNSTVTRIYIKGIRELYEKATVSSHATLSYLFRVLPFVNHQHNIVCTNPFETDVQEIRAMTLGEFADIIGYDRHNIRRLMKQLFNTTFMVGDKETRAINFTFGKDMSSEEMKLYINPSVYYAGDYDEKVEILKAFFK